MSEQPLTEEWRLDILGELAAHLRDAGEVGLLAPVDVKTGVCDECGLVVTGLYCFDCGMWVCDWCWPCHDAANTENSDFEDDEDDWGDDDDD